MIWRETVNIRLHNVDNHHGLRRLVREIQPDASTIANGPVRISLDRSVGIEGDWSVNVFWETSTSHPHKTGLGLNLAEALRSSGIVDHRVWQEILTLVPGSDGTELVPEEER
jgi:hypothetical protein